MWNIDAKGKGAERGGSGGGITGENEEELIFATFFTPICKA